MNFHILLLLSLFTAYYLQHSSCIIKSHNSINKEFDFALNRVGLKHPLLHLAIFRNLKNINM